MPRRPPPTIPPELEGRWTLVGPLDARGGQSSPLLLRRERDSFLGVLRALKASTPYNVERQRREIRALQHYHHPNIIALVEHNIEAEPPWYISEYGDPFPRLWASTRKRLQDRPGALYALALRYIRELLEGLAGLHRLGVVHRDIRPANLIFLPRGEEQSRQRVVLIDFGVAYVPDALRWRGSPPSGGGVPSPAGAGYGRLEKADPARDCALVARLLADMLREQPPRQTWQGREAYHCMRFAPGIPGEAIRALLQSCEDAARCPPDAAHMLRLLEEALPAVEELAAR